MVRSQRPSIDGFAGCAGSRNASDARNAKSSKVIGPPVYYFRTLMPKAAFAPFRPATASDVPALLGLMHTFYVGEGYAFSEPGARAAIVHLLEDDRAGRIWIAQGDQGPLGY